MVRRSGLAGLLVAAALLGCGGGGSGGDGTIQIAYSFSPLRFTAFTDEVNNGLILTNTATVSPLPTEPVFVRVLDSGAGAGAVFTTVTITENANGTFTASLPIRSGLAVGSYTGTLSVQLCKDANCTSQYALSQPSLPYEITVLQVVQGLPPLDAVVKVDGAVVANTNPSLDAFNARTYTLTARTGQVVEITPAVNLLRTSFSPPGTTVRPTLPQPGPGLGYLVTISAPVGSNTQFRGRAEDGRALLVTILTTP